MYGLGPPCAEFGVQANVCVAGLKLAPKGRLLAEKVRALPPGSVAVTWKVKRLPSFTWNPVGTVKTGGPLTVVWTAALVLLAVFGSGVAELTEAELEIGPPWAGAVTVMTMVGAAPTARLARVQVTV